MDIPGVKGDTITFDVFATRGVDPVTGAESPINLTGGKAWFTAKRTKGDADANALISLNTVDDPVGIRFILPPTLGQIRITLVPDDTVNIVDRYVPFDVQIREVDNTVSTVERGYLELHRDITRVSV
jgi:hypothetical protein